jgi:hypothetical protein
MSQTNAVSGASVAQAPGGKHLKLCIFIILSVGVHIGFCLCWGAPEYIRWNTANAIKQEEAAQKLKFKEAIKESAEINERTKDKRDLEEVKTAVVEELKAKIFEDVVAGDFINDKQKEELWKDVSQGLDADLNAYARQLYDNDASLAGLAEGEQSLADKMILELEKEIKERSARQFVDDYIRNIEDTVAPKLADNYKKNIERGIGAPLQQAGSRIVKDEQTLVDRERKELKGALDAAVKQAEGVAKGLSDTKDRIDKARSGNALMLKDAKDRESALAKGEEASIDQAGNQIKNAIDGINNAAGKMGGDAKSKIEGVAKNEGGGAAQAADKAKAAASAGDGGATSKEAGDASTAAAKLGEAINKIKGEIDAGTGDAKSKAEAKSELDKAKKSADAAAAGLKGVGDRAGRAKGASDLAGKTSAAQLDGVMKHEGQNIAAAETALKDVEDRLKNAGDRATAFGEDLKGRIDGAAAKEGKTAQDKTGAAGKAAKDGDISAFKDATGAAADAAKDLAGVAGAARAASDSAQFDPAGLARAVLKDLKDSEIKGALDTAFKAGFEKNALPRLAGKLAENFKKGLATEGINDDAAVAEVESKIRDILGKKIPGLTQAGETGTSALDKTENLGAAKEGDKKNAARVKAVGDKVKSTVSSLADKEMNSLTSDAKGDDAAIGLADLQGAGGKGRKSKGGKKGRHGAGGADSGDASDSEGGGEDGEGGEGGADFAGLLGKVSHRAKNVRAGRSGFMGGSADGDGENTGDGDSDGLGLGGDKGDGKKGTGLASGGSGTEAGDGDGMGMGGDGKGLGGVARLRAQALAIRQGAFGGGGAGRGRGSVYKFDAQAHKELTKDIHERNVVEARGQRIESKEVAGETSLGKASDEKIKYASVILPPLPKEPVFGEVTVKEPYKPKFKTINFASVPYMPGVIKLDGDLSEWKDVAALPLFKNWDGSPQPALKVVEPQLVKAAWDNTGFYLAYDIKDADGRIRKVKPENFWEGDAVEIWFDPQNTKERSRGKKTDQQFWVWPFGMQGDDNKTGGEAIMNIGKGADFRPYGSAEIQRAAKLTPAGWTMEVHIPFERIHGLSLQPGRIIGFNLSICTGTNLYYYWGGTSDVRTSEHPDTWGDLLLSGSDGKLEAVEKLGSEEGGKDSKPLRALQLGEPLRVRVTDSDMNHSDTKRDKVTVTVTSDGGGDSEVLILEETGDKTGVFEGSIATTLNLGDPSPQALSLFEGESVTIVYDDKARANGSQNVEVKLTVKTAAGLMKLAGK